MVVGVLNFMSIYTVSIKSGLRKVTQFSSGYINFLKYINYLCSDVPVACINFERKNNIYIYNISSYDSLENCPSENRHEADQAKLRVSCGGG